MKKIPFVWTNDDIGYGLSENLKKEIDFIENFGIKGTFFIVPARNMRRIDRDTSLIKVIKEAQKRGHEFHQHGYLHTAFECGIPEIDMLEFSEPEKKRFSVQRFKIEEALTLENVVKKLEAGRKIWRKAFGVEPTGFRSPWGAFCKNLYRALYILGYQWCSARVHLWTSWKWCNGNFQFIEPFREGITPHPHNVEGVMEIPIGGDYSFGIQETDIEKFIKLGFKEFNLCHKKNIPFVTVTHWHGLEKNNNSGYRVQEKLLKKILDTGKATPVTVSQLYKKYKSGSRPQQTKGGITK
jgi:peptidoglycan/xylan/chitin deacetylase (PgdA/CDA1 family)